MQKIAAEFRKLEMVFFLFCVFFCFFLFSNHMISSWIGSAPNICVFVLLDGVMYRNVERGDAALCRIAQIAEAETINYAV